MQHNTTTKRFKALYPACCRMIALALALMTGFSLCVMPEASAEKLRLKDVTHIKGVRENYVHGVGMVYGLNRTGDQSLVSQDFNFGLVSQNGIRPQNRNNVRSTNSATVTVTAIVPPFAKAGDKIDVVVSSFADAKSLEGGVLLLTQLKAANGEIVALAQGPLSTGGTSASAGGSSKRTSIVTSARIPGGAILERDIHTDIGDDFGVDILMDRTDFSLANNIADVITNNLAPAQAMDGSSVRVQLPDQYVNNRVGFLAILEQLEVNSVKEVAKVIVNERTGTIVIGDSVKLRPAAVAHGGITVTVKTTNAISQPGALASVGQTVGVTNSEIEITEEPGSLVELNESSTLADLVGALNAIGVTPNDLISILQALKAAGSLEATLEII